MEHRKRSRNTHARAVRDRVGKREAFMKDRTSPKLNVEGAEFTETASDAIDMAIDRGAKGEHSFTMMVPCTPGSFEYTPEHLFMHTDAAEILGKVLSAFTVASVAMQSAMDPTPSGKVAGVYISLTVHLADENKALNVNDS